MWRAQSLIESSGGKENSVSKVITVAKGWSLLATSLASESKGTESRACETEFNLPSAIKQNKPIVVFGYPPSLEYHQFSLSDFS